MSLAQRLARAFSHESLVVRVAARYRCADQPPGARQRARQHSTPINKPKGIVTDVVRDHGFAKAEGSDTVDPHPRDIRPKDVCPPTPDHMGVLNLVESGKDLTKAINKQVPKDKGYDVVRNLSQYLISTRGTGEEGTEEGR